MPHPSPDRRLLRPAAVALPLLLLCSCIFGPSRSVTRAEALQGLQGRLRSSVEVSFAGGQWDDALSVCEAVEEVRPDDCGARYCDFIARSMQAIDRVNDFLVPHHGLGLIGLVLEAPKLDKALAQAIESADTAIAQRCEYDLPTLPLRVGAEDDPLLRGDVRGRWTTRDAHLLAALFSSMRYVMKVASSPQKVPPEDAPVAPLPPLLADMRRHLVAHDALLFSEPADPSLPRGGWSDRNGNHVPDGPDELLIDIFVPGTNRRVFDFSGAEFVRGESLPATPLVASASLPPARCAYQKFHLDDVASGSDVSLTDGMSFSPDGSKITIPLLVKGKSQIVVLGADGKGKDKKCVSCGQPGNNDGVRWRPGTGDTLLFVSDRDHPYAIGNDGGGLGQELYAMRPDGSQVDAADEERRVGDQLPRQLVARWNAHRLGKHRGSLVGRHGRRLRLGRVGHAPRAAAAGRSRHDLVGDPRVHGRREARPHHEHARRTPRHGHLRRRHRDGTESSGSRRPSPGTSTPTCRPTGARSRGSAADFARRPSPRSATVRSRPSSTSCGSARASSSTWRPLPATPPS